MDKISSFFNSIFGSAGKWVILGILGLAVIMVIITFAFFIKYFKIILIVASIVASLAVVGFIVYKKVIQEEQ